MLAVRPGTASPFSVTIGVVQRMVDFNADFFDRHFASPAFFSDPYSVYDALRTHDPVHWSEEKQAWILTRYDDVRKSLYDPRLVMGDRAALYFREMSPSGKEALKPLCTQMSSFLSFLDPPDHTRLRLLVGKALAASAVERLRPEVNRITDDLLERISPQVDLVSQVARPLSCQVMASALGLPKEEHSQFTRWVDALLNFMGSSPRSFELAVAAQESALELRHYLEASGAEQRSKPARDLVNQLLEAEDQGDRLSHDEMISVCTGLVLAGFETSMSLIVNGMLLLMQYPEQLQGLQEDPSTVVSAVEEILRYHTPLQFVMRQAREPISLGDRRIKRGQLLFLMLGAANRDPGEFPSPDRFDTARKPNRHLAFGHGIHFCVGAPLARLQGEIAISKIIESFPGIELDSPTIHWRKSSTHRHPTSLQVRLQS